MSTTLISDTAVWVVSLRQVGDPLGSTVEVIAEDGDGITRWEAVTADPSLRIGDLLRVEVHAITSEAAQ